MTSLWSLHPAHDAAAMAETLDSPARGDHAHPLPATPATPTTAAPTPCVT